MVAQALEAADEALGDAEVVATVEMLTGEVVVGLVADEHEVGAVSMEAETAMMAFMGPRRALRRRNWARRYEAARKVIRLSMGKGGKDPRTLGHRRHSLVFDLFSSESSPDLHPRLDLRPARSFISPSGCLHPRV